MTFQPTFKAMILASACFLSTVALADNGDGLRGKSDDHISATGAAMRDEHSKSPIFGGDGGSGGGGGGGGEEPTEPSLPVETLVPSVTPIAADATSVLRFVNLSGTAGTATVALHDATTGAEVATWTSASIPAHGSLQSDLATIVGAALPALTVAQAAAKMNATVGATFQGTVQNVVITGGVASDLSNCFDGQGVLGGVAGAAHASLMSGIQLTNQAASAQAATVTLIATDGTTLGTWTSPSIPTNGTVTITGAALAAGATPVVAATTASFTVAVSDTAGISVRHLSQPKAGGMVTNLTPACEIGPAASDDSDA